MPKLGFVKRNGVMRHDEETLKWKRRCPLRLWRIRANLTYTEAAAQIGIATNTYSFYEWGRKLPNKPIVRVWNAAQTHYVCHKWDEFIFRHTQVTYKDMVMWHNSKPGGKDA